MSRVTVRAPIQRFSGGSFATRPDLVAGEEPLEIRIGGRALTVTMRTPGHDVELVHGFLHAEGIIAEASDIATIRYCEGVDDQGQNLYNVLDVAFAHGYAPGASVVNATRTFTTSSSCGVCGKASIDALRQHLRHPLPALTPRWLPDVLVTLPDRLREQQKNFRATGGVHAAALATVDGTLSFVREDVGRHNAVDKVIGAALMASAVPVGEQLLLTSSRASFELVQKALVAGIGTLVAVSAPSSLAVELATEAGMTLLGFTRPTGFNIYSGAERVTGSL